jgi:hypothetical protein
VEQRAGVDGRVAHAEALQQARRLLQAGEQVFQRDAGILGQRQQAALRSAFGEPLDGQAATGKFVQHRPGLVGLRGRGGQARQFVAQFVEEKVGALDLGAERMHQLRHAGGDQPLLARDQAGDFSAEDSATFTASGLAPISSCTPAGSACAWATMRAARARPAFRVELAGVERTRPRRIFSLSSSA